MCSIFEYICFSVFARICVVAQDICLTSNSSISDDDGGCVLSDSLAPALFFISLCNSFNLHTTNKPHFEAWYLLHFVGSSLTHSGSFFLFIRLASALWHTPFQLRNSLVFNQMLLWKCQSFTFHPFQTLLQILFTTHTHTFFKPHFFFLFSCLEISWIMHTDFVTHQNWLVYLQTLFSRCFNTFEWDEKNTSRNGLNEHLPKQIFWFSLTKGIKVIFPVLCNFFFSRSLSSYSFYLWWFGTCLPPPRPFRFLLRVALTIYM